jgi:FMN phosphatase YigB (HAD superfamily)
MAYQALIFDLGGVIVPHDNDALYARLAARCRAEGALDRIAAEAPDPRYGTGELGVPALHRRLVDELGYDADWDVFTADFCSHLSIDEDMLALVEALYESYHLLVFSNTNKVHWEHILNLTGGRLGRFEAYLSHEIGAVKPDLSAFALVAERAKLEPGRCLFIDDVMANIEAARRGGFEAGQFTSQPDLEALLQRRGVAWRKLQTTGEAR